MGGATILLPLVRDFTMVRNVQPAVPLDGFNLTAITDSRPLLGTVQVPTVDAETCDEKLRGEYSVEEGHCILLDPSTQICAGDRYHRVNSVSSGTELARNTTFM